jgi:hypothetical protein
MILPILFDGMFYLMMFTQKCFLTLIWTSIYMTKRS